MQSLLTEENRRLKILIIDDDDINNFLCVSVFEDLKIATEIQVVENGEDGLNKLLDPSNENPDLVIFDHHMPVMDGAEMVSYLYGCGFIENSKTVFCLISTNIQQKDIDFFTGKGVQEFCAKPLTHQALLEVYNKNWSDKLLAGM